MYVTEGAPQRARWAVMWVYSANGKRKIARKDFGDDLASALELYSKARDADKPGATLACVNMGFPPPVELRPYTVKKRGRDRRTGRKRIVEVEIQPLRQLNVEGKLWCPYCRKLRPFIKRTSRKLNGIRIPEGRFVCPICGISNRDHHVRFWNPTASLHMDSALAVNTRIRSEKKPRRRRRR